MCAVIPYDCTHGIASHPMKNLINVSESFCSVGREIHVVLM